MLYIRSIWYSNTYNKIENQGGDTNFIEVESYFNKGVYIYLTWQRTAKFVSNSTT